MTDALSQTFSALADPTRRAMLARLKRGEASVTELAEPFLSHMTLGGVTKHLKVLEKAGLVTKGREAQWRPCTLNPKPLKGVSNWMDEYRAYMEDSLDRLGEYLKTMTAATEGNTTGTSPRSASQSANKRTKPTATPTAKRTARSTTQPKRKPGNKR